jgi:SAM-dependent methyltransferase
MTISLHSFVEPFTDPVRDAALHAERQGAAIVLPATELVEFRRHPAAALAHVSAVLESLWRTDGPATVVWCQSGDAGLGVDDFELSAVLGRVMHLELVSQAASGAEKRLIAIGSLRSEVLGIALRIPAAATIEDMANLITTLVVDDVTVTALFVDVTQASLLAQSAAATAALRQFEERGGGVALWVPQTDTDRALQDPSQYVAPLRLLAQTPIECVRFEAGGAITAAQLDRFMRTARLSCDCSIAVDDGAAAEGAVAREGAYPGPSPYRPQPFDLRTPWALVDADAWFEFPLYPSQPRSLQTFWADRRGMTDAELAPLLDAASMEAFFRLIRIRPSEERRYADVRIYNWPRPAPATRVTFLDVGAVGPTEAAVFLTAIRRAIVDAGPRVTIAGHRDMLERARDEVRIRYAKSTGESLVLQSEAHAYLAHIPFESPLRQDYADFARFMPPTLGRALELGSGYGVLARTLAPRAVRYTCLDLDARMFRTLRRDLRQAGVVADVQRLPFAAASFDSVVANNVLEHLIDPLHGLREIRRVLVPGGRLFTLIPFDALSSRHELVAHDWKLDRRSLEAAVVAAGFTIARLAVLNLYERGVAGAFPSCHGYVAMLDAVAGDAANIARESTVGAPAAASAGHIWLSMREIAGFEGWRDRRVITVDAEPGDVAEFRHFGAHVTAADSRAPWAIASNSADLVYAFLTLTPRELPAMTAEIRRVLAPGGKVVAAFRNRQGLRYLSRLRSFVGTACDISRLFGVDAAVALADGDAVTDADYVTADEMRRAFSGFGSVEVSIRNLVPEDIATNVAVSYPDEFWRWLSTAAGRFVMVQASA